LCVLGACVAELAPQAIQQALRFLQSTGPDHAVDLVKSCVLRTPSVINTSFGFDRRLPVLPVDEGSIEACDGAQEIATREMLLPLTKQPLDHGRVPGAATAGTAALILRRGSLSTLGTGLNEQLSAVVAKRILGGLGYDITEAAKLQIRRGKGGRPLNVPISLLCLLLDELKGDVLVDPFASRLAHNAVDVSQI
jgi:hypothetical protein